MQRHPPLLPLVVIAAVLAVALAWREKPADPVAPESRPAEEALFAFPPRAGVVPASLAPLWEGAPPPRFSELRFNAMRTGRMKPVEVTRRMVEAAGWRSVIRQEIGSGVGKSASYLVGPPGLFEAALAWKMESGGQTHRFLHGVREAREVEGSLFPLAVGKRLRFVAVAEGQQWVGSRGTTGELESRFEYEVTGVTDRWARGAPAVPGEVFVIRRRIRGVVDVLDLDGEVEVGETELHYAPALGAVVYEREGSEEEGVRELRLAAWR